jgi:hypothetical protein
MKSPLLSPLPLLQYPCTGLKIITEQKCRFVLLTTLGDFVYVQKYVNVQSEERSVTMS